MKIVEITTWRLVTISPDSTVAYKLR